MIPGRDREEDGAPDGDNYADELREAAIGHQEPQAPSEVTGAFPVVTPGEGASLPGLGRAEPEFAADAPFLPADSFPGDDPLAHAVAASAGARARDASAAAQAEPEPVRRRRRVLPILMVLCLLLGIGLTGWGILLATQPVASGSPPPPLPEMTQAAPEATASEPVPSEPPAASEPPATQGGVPAVAGDVTNADSVTVIVNKLTPLNPQDHVPGDLVSMSSIGVPSLNDHSLRAPAAEAVAQMFQAASAEGYALDMTSGYRSYDSQTELYNGYVASLGQEGADATSARPGHSEHQTGLAADISAPSAGCPLEQCFAQTPEGQWLAANAWRYGFILRYPEGMTSVTGYEFEPWHYRFVGIEVATAMHDGGYATYEQFLGYPAAPGYAG